MNVRELARELGPDAATDGREVILLCDGKRRQIAAVEIGDRNQDLPRTHSSRYFVIIVGDEAA